MFQCGLCDASYVGYTCRHLHQRIEEHKESAIGNHFREQHDMEPEDVAQSFRILRKCQNKFDCLIFVSSNSSCNYFILFHCIFSTPFCILYHILVLATFLSILTCFNIFMLITQAVRPGLKFRLSFFFFNRAAIGRRGS